MDVHMIELNNMSKTRLEEIDKNSLVEVSTISVDKSISHIERINSIITQLKNPYCFISGDTPIRVRFAEDGKNLTQSLIDYFSELN